MKKRSVTKKVLIPLLMAASLTSAMLTGCQGQTSASEVLNSAESVLAAAQEKADKETAAAENVTEETLAPAPAEAAETVETAETTETPEEAAKTGTETAVETTDTENTGAEDMTTLEFAQQLSIGWNLGNTLDAYTMQAGGNQGLASETCWQHTKTTQAMFKALKEAGFETVRIPVSWHNHMTDVDAHTIDPKWMDRVAEIVDYALDEDLYVIVNIHHDNGSDRDCITLTALIWKRQRTISVRSGPRWQIVSRIMMSI